MKAMPSNGYMTLDDAYPFQKRQYDAKKRRTHPTQRKRPNSSTRAKRNCSLFFKSANEILSSMKIFEPQCQYLQMKILNGFSNLPARTDGFTAESECRNGFPVETLVFSPSSSPNSNFKMNSQ
jgi:hypothetical protein